MAFGLSGLSRTTNDAGQDSAQDAPAGRCCLYVFPCTWEDHCKIGFSRDPLSRMQAMHHRYFEFFDLDGGWLVEAETERDARDLELQLHHLLAAYSAPSPLVVRRDAGGHTEWFRGAQAVLPDAIELLRQRGHAVHDPLRSWMRRALLQRADQLYAWSEAQLSAGAWQLDAPSAGVPWTPAQQLVRDSLDAYVALEIDVAPWLPPDVAQWYCAIC